VSERLLTSAELIDLHGSDSGLNSGIDAGHESTCRAKVAQEAHDVDDLADLRKPLAAVFVEVIDRTRTLQGESHAVVAPCIGHNWTMAGGP